MGIQASRIRAKLLRPVTPCIFLNGRQGGPTWWSPVFLSNVFRGIGNRWSMSRPATDGWVNGGRGTLRAKIPIQPFIQPLAAGWLHLMFHPSSTASLLSKHPTDFDTKAPFPPFTQPLAAGWLHLMFHPSSTASLLSMHPLITGRSPCCQSSRCQTPRCALTSKGVDRLDALLPFIGCWTTIGSPAAAGQHFHCALTWKESTVSMRTSAAACGPRRSKKTLHAGMAGGQGSGTQASTSNMVFH